jgi:hypothetical protein
MSTFSVSDKYINRKCGLHLKDYQEDKEGVRGVYDSKTKFICCANHEHVTREQYDIVIDKITKEFVNAGCEETVKHYKPNVDIHARYATLQTADVNVKDLSVNKSSHSNAILKQYMGHIYTVEDNKGNSVSSSWTETKIRDTFKRLDKRDKTVNSQFSEFLRCLSRKPITMYSPLMSKSILDELERIEGAPMVSVFDPCIGWGGRMLGTTSRGGHYTGCEPNTETFTGLCHLRDDLQISNQVTLYNSGVEDILSSLEDEFFDVCLTSPPYYDLEIYSKETSQSTQKFSSYEEWLTEFIEPIIEYVCSHVIHYSCWSVKNFKTDKMYPFKDDIVKIHAKFGWTTVKEYQIQNGTDHTYAFSHPDVAKY